jgi:hypothetical protein
MLHQTTNSKIHRIVIVLGLFLLLFQTACTTTTTAGQRPARNAGRVEVGDTVRILTKDGTVHEFEVVALTLMSIIGTDDEVFSEDISRVDVRETDGWRHTDVTVASILGAPLLFVDGYALASISPTAGPGQ